MGEGSSIDSVITNKAVLEAPRNKRIKDEAYGGYLRDEEADEFTNEIVFKLRRTDLEIIQLPTDGEAVLPLLQESSHKTVRYLDRQPCWILTPQSGQA